MDIATLSATAKALVAPGKGILAADESSGTIKKRFDSIGCDSTEDRRRAYREMLFTAKGAADAVSGVILVDRSWLRFPHTLAAVRHVVTSDEGKSNCARS